MSTSLWQLPTMEFTGMPAPFNPMQNIPEPWHSDHSPKPVTILVVKETWRQMAWNWNRVITTLSPMLACYFGKSPHSSWHSCWSDGGQRLSRGRRNTRADGEVAPYRGNCINVVWCGPSTAVGTTWTIDEICMPPGKRGGSFHSQTHLLLENSLYPWEAMLCWPRSLVLGIKMSAKVLLFWGSSLL